ncbi:hypothetical protein OIU35_20395 [Boseaceae bacterium BT-24-1]|nr:hypothetical protein [Boseaceae bacterium BT-24-1]
MVIAVTKPPLLIEYCEGAVTALRAQYAMTSVLGHAATAGAAREKLIIDFLIDHLPEMTSVVSGVIVDAKGNRSKQQDIVLMQKAMPRLRFASDHDLIFQEGTIATFEIKTAIRGRKLIREIGDNIRSVKLLSSTSKGATRLGDLWWPPNRIMTAVLTYGGARLPEIATFLEEIADPGKPDIYFDLSKGMLLRNELLFGGTNDAAQPYFAIDSAARALARFVTMLARLTASVQISDVKWDEYIGKAEGLLSAT